MERRNLDDVKNVNRKTVKTLPNHVVVPYVERKNHRSHFKVGNQVPVNTAGVTSVPCQSAKKRSKFSSSMLLISSKSLTNLVA